MAWYGDIQLEGERGSDIRTLAEGIEQQQDIFAGGMGKKEEREKGRRLLWSILKNPFIDKALAESDKKKAPKWMRKLSDMLGYDLSTIDYGDPEAISSLETPWTQGKAEDYGDELTEMQEEADIPWWETFLGERKQEFDIGLQLLPFVMKGGGRVPSPKKYYGGGSVYSDNNSPTIYDYFEKQGKTIGGSHTQSLAEQLGRK